VSVSWCVICRPIYIDADGAARTRRGSAAATATATESVIADVIRLTGPPAFYIEYHSDSPQAYIASYPPN